MELKPKTNLVLPVILSKMKIKDFVFGIVFLFLLGTTLFFYFNYHKLKSEMYVLTNPQAQAAVNKAEANQLVAEISKVMNLPQGEDPVVGTIKDVESLVKTQKFFVGSQNGDKILIYKDKAIIYRPETNKIINVGPVYIDTNNDVAVDTTTSTINNDVESMASSTDSISVEVRNGSGIAGADSVLGNELKNLVGYKLDKVGDAATSTYGGNLVVNLTGKNIESLLTKIKNAKIINKLPIGEADSLDDVVVILGKQ